MIVHHKKYIPAFGFTGHMDQYPVAIITVLSINETVGDCAAYEGVLTSSNVDDDDYINKVWKGGNKIPEAKAREMFHEIEDMKLRYRL